MSLSNISEQLRTLQEQIISFTGETQAALSILSPRSEATGLLAGPSYERIHQAYERISATLFSNRNQIVDRHYYNTLNVATDLDYLTNTDLVETLDNAHRVFTDRFVTSYPDVPINYGRACVSPREKWSSKDLSKHDALAPYRAQYPNFRAIRGDGNCFFSGITVKLLEHVVQTKQVDTLLQRILEHPEWDSPGKDVVVQLLMELAETPSMLETRLQNNQKVLCCVNLFRHIAADHMNKHRDTFEPFLEKPFDEYIRDNVLKMGENAEHCAIIALCKELDFPVIIHDVGVDTNDQGTHLGHDYQPALATLCRNGEHYFAFYADDTVLSSPVQSPTLSRPYASASSASVSSLLFQFTPPPGVTLEVRGKGPGMHDWSVGIPLQNLGANLWSWNCDQAFEPFVYKIVGRTTTGELLWESGKDRIMKPGDSEFIEPRLTPAPAPKAQLTVQFTPPPGITLELRGKGPGMHNWSVGIPLQQVDGNIWSWTYDQTFEPFVYKIVGRRTDGELVWESGDDRIMKVGDAEAIVPKLDLPSVPSTQLTIQCIPQPGITFELRGKGGPGTGEWSHGLPLKHIEGNIWSLELNEAFEPFEYKIVGRRSTGELIWESGDNRIMKAGQSEVIQPRL